MSAGRLGSPPHLPSMWQAKADGITLRSAKTMVTLRDRGKEVKLLFKSNLFLFKPLMSTSREYDLKLDDT